jgi:hypothetical protein
MLTQRLRDELGEEPEYRKLSDEKKTLILRRLIKVYNAHDHRKRADAVRAEERKIAQELRNAKGKT